MAATTLVVTKIEEKTLTRACLLSVGTNVVRSSSRLKMVDQTVLQQTHGNLDSMGYTQTSVLAMK